MSEIKRPMPKIRMLNFDPNDEHGKRNRKEGVNWISKAFFSFFFVALVTYFFPSVLPFGMFEFWHTKGTWIQWLYAGLPLFAWAFCINFYNLFTTRNHPDLNKNAESVLAGGFLISVWAGVMEEICFRWLIFMSGIIGIKIVNFLFFGWLGFGLPEFFQNWLFGPIANFFTLGYLATYLVNPVNWAIGSSMLSANALFRNGHAYQGCLGWINSWFMGMAFFWIMLTYGLPAAILVHFAYDMLIFCLLYVDCAIERAQGG